MPSCVTQRTDTKLEYAYHQTMRYFFDLKDSKFTYRDEQGQEFASLQDAEAEAIKSLSDIARDARAPKDFADAKVEVRNEASHIVLRMTLLLDIERSPMLKLVV